MHGKSKTDLEITTEDKRSFQETMDEFVDEVSEMVDFYPLNVYTTSVEWSGKVIDQDLEFLYSIGENNGVYINGTLSRVDDEFLDYADRQLMLEDAANQEMLLAQSVFDLKSELDAQEKANKLKAASEIAASTMALADLVGKQTAVGKGLAIAATTIETYSAAQSAYKRGLEVPYVGMVLGPLNAAIAIAQGLQRVKAIAAVKVPGSSSSASISGTGGTSAPIGTRMGATALQQAQINAAGNAAVQAFVLESDVSGNQERIERLNRAARIQ